MDGEWTPGGLAEGLSPNQPLRELGDVSGARPRPANTLR